jgi:cold shock CspA family protein
MEFWTCRYCDALTRHADVVCWKCRRAKATADSREFTDLADGTETVDGLVKWFSVEKGFGFIHDAHGTDHYFTVRDVVGSELPMADDGVRFKAARGDKGGRARAVELVSRSEVSGAADRVVCNGCGKQMVPRVITHRGSLSKSVCPFCGATYKEFGWCFVASAVYGESADEVVALRRFRDSTLRRTGAGRLCIRIYYKVSPAAARFVYRAPWVRGVVRKLLDCLVKRIA